MVIIPFANALGPNGGPAGDGVIYGIIPQVAPVTALSQIHLAPFTKIYRGNADVSGNVMWSNVTVAANDDATGDISLFDTANPTADRLCIELSAGDEINGISLLISTAASVAGTPAVVARYKRATDNTWTTATNTTTPALTMGLRTITFDAIKYADIALTDDVINPVANTQQRCVFVEFSGITAVTTAPLFTRIWKNVVHGSTHKASNFTTLTAQGANPDFSTAQAAILPVANDLTLFGFDEKPTRLFPTIYRASAAAHLKEWIYSQASAFAALPTANFSDPSTRFETQNLGTAHQRTNLTSTLTTGSWGNSGIASTETLSGDGYIEFRVGANATLAAMLGFSETNANANYASINWAIHVGHGATAFGSNWRNGAQQAGGAWAIVTGDVLRLERRSGVFSIYQNGTLQHTFAVTSTNPVLVDAAFIFLAAVTDFVLVNKLATGLEVPVIITWKDNVAVTVANGGTQQFGVVTTHQIPLVPPADWAKQTLTDTADVAHSRYWIGFRTTSNVASTINPANFTMRAQMAKGTGNEGIPAPETATYTTATVACRDTSLAATTLLLVNATSGATASVAIPVNTAIATVSINLPVTTGDRLLLVQALGHPTVNIGDGFIQLN